MTSRYSVHPMEQAFADWEREHSAIRQITSKPLKYKHCDDESLKSDDSTGGES
jgi:hypothetical protein